METAKELLCELRKEIAVIDKQLVSFWKVRMRLAKQLAECKSELGLPVTDREQERLLWERWQGFLADMELNEELKVLFDAVLSSSKRRQSHFATALYLEKKNS